MSNIEHIIMESGVKKRFLADKLSITPQTLRNRFKYNDWTFNEVCVLSRLLGIRTEEQEELFGGVNNM